MQVLRPAAAAVGEVLAMGDQPLVQLAGEQRDAVHSGVVAEEVAGEADLAAAAGAQQSLIEVRPLLDRRLLASRVCASAGMRWVPFIGQAWPLTSLTQGGWNGFQYNCRPHGGFCLPGNFGVLHGHTSIGIEPG